MIDLKTDELTHGAIGQMDMYVRMYNDLKKATTNPTIGIILCTLKELIEQDRIRLELDNNMAE